MLLLGLVIWVGRGDQLIPVHSLLGLLLILSLWTLAALAARSRVSIGLVVAALVWGLIAPILGYSQDQLVLGEWHWVIQALHLVAGLGAIVLRVRLEMLIERMEAAPGRHTRSA